MTLVLVLLLCVAGALARGAAEGDKWGEVQDPDGDCKVTQAAGKIAIEVPGTYHDLWADPQGKVNAARVLKGADGDFIFEVKAAGKVETEEGTGLARNPFRAATAVIWQDENNFVRLDRAGMFKDGKKVFFCYFHIFKDGKRTVHLSKTLPNKPALLRLERHGSTLLASAQPEGSEQWIKFDEQQIDLPAKVKVGVAGLNNTNVPFVAEFEQMKINPSPGGS
jgi:regulation of enolase protein 1 (concanavalin A-like superfamily)